jgi:VWFA-related protein
MRSDFSGSMGSPLRSIWILLLLVLVAPSQGQEGKAERDSASTIRVTVNLVSVNVAVTDKKGKPINDLTQNDFLIMEDKVPQKITVFKVQAPAGMETTTTGRESSPGSREALLPLSRKVVLFVDDYHISSQNLVRLRGAGAKFIRSNVGPEDLIALNTASGRNSTELVKDREFVIQNLMNLQPILRGAQSDLDCPPLSDYQAVDINQHQILSATDIRETDDSYKLAIDQAIRCMHLSKEDVQTALNQINMAARMRAYGITDLSRRTLEALGTSIRKLGTIEGQKIFVFLSDGLLTRDLSRQLQGTIDNAIRSNTIIYAISSAGLMAMSPVGSAANPVSPLVFGSYSSLQTWERQAKEEAPADLASGTGGFLLHDNNDLAGLMKSALNRAQVSYLIGYYSTNVSQDGKFRKIAVKVNRPHAIVTARKGYFAPGGDETVRAKQYDDIREAMQRPEDFKDIPVSSSCTVTHPDPSHPLVAILTHIDVTKIPFVNLQNHYRNTLTIMTEIYDSADNFLEGKRTQISFNLAEANYKIILAKGYVFQGSFELLPGNYWVRTVVREDNHKTLGGEIKRINIMNE